MQPELIESMRHQVRAIYRIVTGDDLPESQVSDTEPQAELEDITRSFAELEALMRSTPSFAQRIPPFSFTPALDAFRDGDEVVVEVAVPGVDRKEIAVECAGRMLVVRGIRRARTEGGYSHAEIPCGPFVRSFEIPFPVSGEPAVHLTRGILRIRLRGSGETQQKEVTPQ